MEVKLRLSVRKRKNAPNPTLLSHVRAATHVLESTSGRVSFTDGGGNAGNERSVIRTLKRSQRRASDAHRLARNLQRRQYY